MEYRIFAYDQETGRKIYAAINPGFDGLMFSSTHYVEEGTKNLNPDEAHKFSLEEAEEFLAKCDHEYEKGESFWIYDWGMEVFE